jgi:hypothetical protein
LRINTSTGQWLDITKAANQGRGTNSPIYSGAIGEYNSVILRQSYDVCNGISAGGALVSTAYRAEDFPAILSEKDRFYEVLCLGARNPVVHDLLTRLNSKINRLRSLSRSNSERGPQSLREIEAIAAALRTRSPELSRAAAVAHVERAAEAALKFEDALAKPAAA